MASIKLRGSRWWVKFRDPATRRIVERSLGPRIRSRQQAEIARQRLEGRLATEHELPESVTLGIALERFLADKAPPQRARWTWLTYTRHAANFRRLLPVEALLVEIRAQTVKTYRASRLEEGVAALTVNHELVTLGTLFRWAMRENDPPLCERNPVDAVKPLPLDEPPADRAPCEPEVFARLIAELRRKALEREGAERWIRELYADVAEFAWWTGFRAGEICRLEPADLDLAAGACRVRSARNKGPAPRYPLPPQVTALLKRRLALEKPYLFSTSTGGRAYGALYKFRTQTLKKVAPGLLAIPFHALRHAYTTALDEADVSDSLRMKLTRHSTPRMLHRYTHRDLAAMRGAQEKVARLRSRPPRRR